MKNKKNHYYFIECNASRLIKKSQMIQNILWFESIALVIKARIRTQQKRKKHTTTKRFYPWACILRTCIKNRYPPPQPRSARCLCSIFIRRMVGKAREEGPSAGKLIAIKESFAPTFCRLVITLLRRPTTLFSAGAFAS